MDTVLLSVSSPGRQNELTDVLKKPWAGEPREEEPRKGDSRAEKEREVEACKGAVREEAREVVCADSPETAGVEASGVDLWVLDLRMLNELGLSALQAHKERTPNVASPALLVAPDSRLSQIDPALWNCVDDVIGTPLRRAELTGRAQALLRMRAYSVEAEKARREASSKYKALFDSSAHGILLLSDGTVEEANARAGRLFGRRPEALVGEQISALSAPEQAAEDKETHGQAVEGEAASTLQNLLVHAEEEGEASAEWKFVPPEGGGFWADFTLASVTYGGEEYVQAVFRNVTPRRRARTKLKKSQDLLRRAQEVAGVGGWEYDPEDGRVVGTDQLNRILGLPEGSNFTLERGFQFFPPDARKRIQVAVRQCLQDARPFDLEVPFVTEEEEERWGRVRGHPRREEGVVTRMVGTLRDITERKNAKEKLRQSRERLKSAQRIANLGSWERDLKRDEVHWSEETRSIFGWSEEEPVTYEKFMSRVHPEDRAALREAQEAAIEDGTPIDMEYRIVRPDGEERIVRERGEVERAEDGTPVRLFGAVLEVTDRRRREEKIERLRNKYRGLLKGAPNAIFIADQASGKIIEANRAAADLLETSVEDLIGRPQVELHPPEDKDRYGRFFEEHLQSAREGRETFSRFEDGSPLLVMTDSGERVPVEISGTPVKVEGEEYAMGIFRDVRRRRRAQSRRRIFEQAVKHSGDAIFITDTDGEILYVNPATEEITGYEEEELLGRTPSLLQSGEMPEETYEELWNTLQRGEVYRNTFTDEAKDGSRIELDEVIVPIEGTSGEIQYYAATGRDVTEQKETERKLRQSEERFRGIFENAAMGIAVLNEEGHLVETNPALQEMFGYRAEELQGTHFGEISYSEDLPKDRQRYEELMSGERNQYQMEKRYVRKDGEIFWGHLTVSRHEKEGDQQLIGMIEDIDNRKRYEEGLREAKKEAEEAADLKSAMLANMSHEIRTPLTSIIGFAQAIGELVEDLKGSSGEADFSQLGHFAELIEQGGTRLLDTLEGVLHLSKLEAGQMGLDAEAVDLADQVRQTAQELQPKAEEKGLDLQVRAGDSSVQALADEGAVQIALQNLVSNAIKYTENGRVEVRASQENGSAVIEVEDTGVGMDPEMIEELFEPFRQASEGLAREYEGTGVGLAVTRKAIEEMGGSIEVETEKGEGSRFTVRLPKAGPGAAINTGRPDE